MIRFLVALTASIAALAWYNRRAVRHAEARHPMVGKLIAVDGVRLHFLERGEGRPVVLIHGSDGVLQDFTLPPLFDLIAAEYRAIAFDRPGHGYSERSALGPLRVGMNVRLIHGALRSLGVERPVLVGHSYGGTVALEYALEHPAEVGGLVLLAPAAFSLGAAAPLLFSLPDAPVLGPLLLRALLVPAGRRILRGTSVPAFRPDPVPPDFLETMSAYSLRPGQFRSFAEETRWHPLDVQAISHRYAEILAPVTIITGAADVVAPPQLQSYPLHRAIRQSRLVVLPETGHALQYRHPEAVRDAIRQVARAVV